MDPAKVKAQDLAIEQAMSSAYWRINPVSIMASAIAFISVFLPWWGIYELFGSDLIPFRRWALYNPPGSTALRTIGRPETLSAATTSQIFTVSSMIVLVLALIAAALALAGGLTLLRKYLVAGLVTSILTPVAYTITIAYVTSNYCLTLACVAGPMGTTTFIGTTFNWGFETGFFLFIVATAILALSYFLNNSLARTTARPSVPTSQRV